MNYIKPDMWVLVWEDEMLPITQVSEGNPFEDWEDGGDMPIE